ncbi:MAG TPA: lysine--tRNA ligase [Candidatus Pacebacteria bacterium]|nr:MAG: Lysine-tRNA ligase [Microgenomates group bacterium GW2011_GWF1_44_10]HAU99445.1 lysine--tRNA ligase [Candidatus Paceibacterota bacterium]HAX01549.1 lysine--tRNA ligase [Candidatus Paceibacterota bacterium]
MAQSRLQFSREAKIEKRRALENAGVSVHPYSFSPSHSIKDALEAQGNVTIAGRIISLREHGKLSFIVLKDETAELQLICKSDVLSTYDLLAYLDTGDFIGVVGKRVQSQSGQESVEVNTLTVLGKSLRPLPNAWQNLDDPEIRYRKRYLDLLIHPDAKRILDARWLIVKEIRRYLQDTEGFTEVETPILQPLYGGTNAKPFTTYMNALDVNFYLRIAPELYLKRLIVGGYERIFEIARNFRNEGIDQTHQPEFSMIEWYEAYADYQRMMDVAEGLIKHVAQKLNGTYEVMIGEKLISLAGAWPRIRMIDALTQFADISVEKMTDEQLQSLLDQHHLKIKGSFSRGKAIFELFDKLVTPQLIQPTWIIDYPKEVSPLAKQHRLHPDEVERYEGYIGGKEICDGWSEITDGLEQRKRFEVEQQHMREGDDEAQPTDEAFLEAMEYGMPPLGGIGIGIDRLVMFLTNTWSIKEVIAFPTLRPEKTVDAPQKAQQNPPSHISKTTQSDIDLDSARTLLRSHMKNEALIHHSEMVADAMRAYAEKLGEDVDLWYATGLLHDMDWEEFPDEHPNKAIAEWLGEYPQELREAIAAHAPERTGREPQNALDRYLFACDELSGLMHAASLMRPTGFQGMEVSSVKKKIKDKGFAKNVSREDIARGIELIESSVEDHVAFLLGVFEK